MDPGLRGFWFGLLAGIGCALIGSGLWDWIKEQMQRKQKADPVGSAAKED